MRITNETQGTGGAFAELVRLQTDFQARLADETLRYLRRLQGMSGPSAPGTVISATDGMEVKGEGTEGGTVSITLEVQNMQPVYCVVLPQLTPLVSQNGTTWLPVIDTGTGSLLVAPGAIAVIALSVGIPDSLTPGTYRGALILQGFREAAIPITVDISEAAAPKADPPKTDPPKTDPPKTDEGKKDGGLLSDVIGTVTGANQGTDTGSRPATRPK